MNYSNLHLPIGYDTSTKFKNRIYNGYTTFGQFEKLITKQNLSLALVEGRIGSATTNKCHALVIYIDKSLKELCMGK
jgi:hypothetical protein